VQFGQTTLKGSYFDEKTKSGKAKKRKPIRTCGKTEADKQNVPPIIIASSNWLFRFPLFLQGVNPPKGIVP